MRFDAVIVGSGAGGAAMAWRLSQAGMKVGVLEQGDWFTGADFSKEGWELEGHRRLSPVPSQRMGEFDMKVDSSSSDIEVSFFQAVGGSTNIYSGHFPRFRPEDFNRHSKLGVGVDWPIDYEDLRPFYETNEIRMKVAGRVGDPSFPDLDSLGKEVPVGEIGNMMSAAFKKLGWHCWVSYGAFDTQVGSDSVCKNLGPCNLGCPIGAKMTAKNGYLDEAIRNGVEVLHKSSASELIVRNGLVSEVKVRKPGGQEFSVKADIVILAAGALGTAKILLASNEANPMGLSNSSGQVGKNLMVHPLGLAEGLFEGASDVSVGPRGSWLYSLEFGDFLSRTEPGFMLQMLRGTDLVNLGRRAVRSNKLGPKLPLPAALQPGKYSVGIAVVVEDLPDPANKIELDYSTRDAFGLPGLKVTYGVDEPARKALINGLTSSRQVLQEMGAQSTHGIGPVRGAGWHPSGTARMGDDPNSSVVNGLGQSHEIPNLYICDSSVFPTGSCLNPTNTIQAVSLLFAEGIVSGHK
jgi:choline dehydrogenase-like flavoprotein